MHQASGAVKLSNQHHTQADRWRNRRSDCTPTARSLRINFLRLLPIRGERAARQHIMAGLLARLIKGCRLPKVSYILLPQWHLAPPSLRRLTATGLRRTHTCFPFHRLSAAPWQRKTTNYFIKRCADYH